MVVRVLEMGAHCAGLSPLATPPSTCCDEPGMLRGAIWMGRPGAPGVQGKREKTKIYRLSPRTHRGLGGQRGSAKLLAVATPPSWFAPSPGLRDREADWALFGAGSHSQQESGAEPVWCISADTARNAQRDGAAQGESSSTQPVRALWVGNLRCLPEKDPRPLPHPAWRFDGAREERGAQPEQFCCPRPCLLAKRVTQTGRGSEATVNGRSRGSLYPGRYG